LHKETKKSFSQVVKDLYEYGAHVLWTVHSWSPFNPPLVNPKNGRPASMISQETYEIVRDNAELLDSTIIYNRDFNYNL
jgi:ribonucleoside-diphosphate reductase subunit M1